ncbi:CAMK/CAMKL/MARK protein kinase, variant [Sphaeroforma arctica JP610]|uniref:CAMK/CAMKL/MARK protein kinase, variant n=1 Tax=Sphaeroforma arctica JP610 TaxID=667725 RepID=A0A0L0G858_9EUKA|nr:CAMK/CAMKL/MARK protein kinase, variant [Sphaeroforma arctica JP610]KNC85222.1 CAMK/CAMKL/MARK protein kinase, variant [Sphaeroforma arctica JP610]|eukprot:XP_014159124.1 CAMK/CAMKL/MARK protein kinase, variant [Sphaeroforma arctica JP610]
MVGNYKIIKKVGKGRFSSVMLARHLFTGQQVAVKMVEKKYLDENELNTLMREVGILKQLNHPNIVRLFEVIITSETIYLVQEYCPHGEFYDYLVPKGKMKEEEAKKCFYQIFSAINYCHSEMVVHRDLKPENVLLDADLNIKLADFGLSRFYDPNEKCKTFCGSPFYAAPEIFTGTPYTGPEPDIWALGVMVYTVVSGILPFENASAATEGRYTMDDDISIHCQSLIRGCLQPDRYRRCTIKDCVMSEWIRDVSGGAEGIPGTNKEALLNLDQEILQLMESSGYKASDVLDSVSTDRFDDPYATYMLYRERKLKYPQLHNAVLADLMSSLQIKSGTPSPLPKAFASGDISQQAIQNVTTLDGRKLSMENFASELGMDIGTSLDNSHWGLAVTTTKGNKSADHSPEPPANTSYRTSMSSVGTPKSTTTIPESPTGLSSSSSFKHKQPRAKRSHKRTARVSRLSLISRTISYRPAKEIYDIVQNVCLVL